jgi:hypothetical protein
MYPRQFGPQVYAPIRLRRRIPDVRQASWAFMMTLVAAVFLGCSLQATAADTAR